MPDIKFKPGDRVYQVYEVNNQFNAPGEHVVRKCTTVAVYFEDDRSMNGYSPDRFELSEPTAPVYHGAVTGRWESGDSRAKDTNPKDAVGTKKPPMSTVSAPVMMELGTAMLEGARKYGRHNYRISNVRASVYYDAALRHLFSWFEGEDIDPDSGMSHVTKAIASLAVLRDAQINDCLVDDRPPSSKEGWKDNLQENVDDIFERYPEAKEAYTIGSTKD